MEEQGRGHRGGGRSNNPIPPAFDQQAFMEAIGAATSTIEQASAATATIAQTSATAGQGGLSNQRFKAHHPPTFMGGGDSMVGVHWFRQVEKVLEAMEITSDAVKIRLAVKPGKNSIFFKKGKTVISVENKKFSRSRMAN